MHLKEVGNNNVVSIDAVRHINFKVFHPALHGAIMAYCIQTQSSRTIVTELESLRYISAYFNDSNMNEGLLISECKRIETLIKEGKTPSEAIGEVFPTVDIRRATKRRIDFLN